jgi:hypothetical protein
MNKIESAVKFFSTYPFFIGNDDVGGTALAALMIIEDIEKQKDNISGGHFDLNSKEILDKFNSYMKGDK